MENRGAPREADHGEELMQSPTARALRFVRIAPVVALVALTQTVAAQSDDTARGLLAEFRRARDAARRVDLLRSYARLGLADETIGEAQVRGVLASCLDDDPCVAAEALAQIAELPDRNAATESVVAHCRKLRLALEREPEPDLETLSDLNSKRLRTRWVLPKSPRLDATPAERKRIERANAAAAEKAEREVARLDKKIERVKEEVRSRLAAQRKRAEALTNFAARLAPFRDERIVEELASTLELVLERTPRFADAPAVALCTMGSRESLEPVVRAYREAYGFLEFHETRGTGWLKLGDSDYGRKDWHDVVQRELEGACSRLGIPAPPTRPGERTAEEQAALVERLMAAARDVGGPQALLDEAQRLWTQWWKQIEPDLPRLARSG